MINPLILIVDDEHANQFLLEGLLTANGYRTICSNNGEECLEILSHTRPELILLDIMMPKMTGIEVLKKVTTSEELKNIPVLIVSAKTGTTDIKEALELGAIDYVRKPFDEIELLARVKVGVRLKQNEDNLREMIAQRDTFVQLISHDLRSPFTAIYGLAEILMNDENLTNDQKESIGYIIDSVEFSQDYFNKLLSWTKLEHHEIGLDKKEFSICILFEKVIKLYEKKAGEKGIKIKNTIDPLIKILIDDTFFKQAIGNLIGNALKYTPPGGTIRCFNEQSDKSIVIVISDNGIGMPDDMTNEKLFQSSIVESRRGTKGEKGTGIGLGICKKILDAHKFNLNFRRNQEGGTDFTIVLTT
jgi:two-component system sensor histidine kinase/response regulator